MVVVEVLCSCDGDVYVVVIGVGNVVIDCVWVLLRDADAFAGTDICEYALEVLCVYFVCVVFVIG